MQEVHLSESFRGFIEGCELYLGSYYKIGSEGFYDYFIRFGDFFEIKKMNVNDYGYDDFSVNNFGVFDLWFLIDVFNHNVSISCKEDKFYDYEKFDFGKLILDDYDRIIGFKKDF